MTMTFTEISSYDLTPPYTLGVDVIFTSYSISADNLVITSDGDMSMLLSEDVADNMRLVYSGNSITTSDSGVVETLTSYRYDMEANDISGDYSLDMQGTINSTEIGGSVSFDTLTTFTGNDYVANSNPTAGVLLITGTDNSQARVTAMSDGINVQIEIDADGDGLYETTTMTTWTELEST
jgi:hypothetical protein